MITEGREKGIKFVLPVDFVIQDGSVVTELKPSDEQFAQRFRGAPPEVTGAAIAWLCSSDDALELAGTLVHSQPLCKRRQLLEGWPPA